MERERTGAFAAALAVALAVAVAGWPGAAGADHLSPRAALMALPAPPARPEEARARWRGGVDRAVEPVRQGARYQLAAARSELGGRDAFERDPGERRAAAARLAPSEVSAVLALQQAHAAQPVELSRQVEALARSKRLRGEEQAREIEEARARALAACRDRACALAAERQAREARARLLASLLEQTAARWELLRMRLDYLVAERQRLAERVATASSDPYVRRQAQGLLAEAWKTVAELADEVERETELAARLAQ